MRKALFVSIPVLLIVGFFVLPVIADDHLARFKGGIGVIPLATAGVLNNVRGVPPAGQPWVIADLRADVRVDGRISVDGRGLLLGGGTNIGTNGGQSVGAELLVDGAGRARAGPLHRGVANRGVGDA